MLSVFSDKDDGVNALDFKDGAITEFDDACDRTINFSEVIDMARHVICSTGAMVPALDSLGGAASPKADLCFRLIGVKGACSRVEAVLSLTTMVVAHFDAPPWQ